MLRYWHMSDPEYSQYCFPHSYKKLNTFVHHVPIGNSLQPKWWNHSPPICWRRSLWSTRPWRKSVAFEMPNLYQYQCFFGLRNAKFCPISHYYQSEIRNKNGRFQNPRSIPLLQDMVCNIQNERIHQKSVQYLSTDVYAVCTKIGFINIYVCIQWVILKQKLAVLWFIQIFNTP